MNYPQYEALLQKGGIQPNFFISEPYFDVNEWVIEVEGRKACVRGDGDLLFPPVLSSGKLGRTDEPIWVDFEGYQIKNRQPSFFDHEFIYCSDDFEKLDGGRFATFRKNCRRFRRKFERKWSYSEVKREKAAELFLDWMIDGIDYVEAPETIVDYLLAADNIIGLFIGKELIGFNSWDSNFQFLNFRYSFTLRRENYASEFLRLCFYRNLPKGTLVNDGGTLGSPGLERFKRKLNPREVRRRQTWE